MAHSPNGRFGDTTCSEPRDPTSSGGGSLLVKPDSVYADNRGQRYRATVEQSLAWPSRRNCNTTDTGGWLSGPSEWGTSGWPSLSRASSCCGRDPRRGFWPLG